MLYSTSFLGKAPDPLEQDEALTEDEGMNCSVSSPQFDFHKVLVLRLNIKQPKMTGFTVNPFH